MRKQRHLSFGLTLDDTGLLHGACGDAAWFGILAHHSQGLRPARRMRR